MKRSIGTKSRDNLVDGSILRRLIDISDPKAVWNDDAREKYSTKEEIF